MKQDTLKYIIENLKRAGRLQRVIQEATLEPVSLRDKVVQRNCFVNEAIRVANTELGANLAEVRYRKENIEAEVKALFCVLETFAKEEKHAV